MIDLKLTFFTLIYQSTTVYGFIDSCRKPFKFTLGKEEADEEWYYRMGSVYPQVQN